MSLDIYDRIDSIEKVIHKEEWLMLDKYEALHYSIPVNFTTVIERLKHYIHHHTGVDVDIVYVFGGDNQYFSYAFSEIGEYVCINRSAKENLNNVERLDHKRHHFVSSPERVVEQSSTEIRTKDTNTKKEIRNEKPYYLVRDDALASTKDLPFDVNEEQKTRLLDIIASYSHKKIVTLDVKKQEELLKDILKSNRMSTVSLDIYYTGDINLDMCRLFELSDTQHTPLTMKFRTNEAQGDDILDSLKELDVKEVALVDDDTASGNTIRMVEDILNQSGIHIKDKWFLNNVFLQDKGIDINDVFDIVDMRDFIIGARYGGLCINIPDKRIGRAMYTYPYVNLKTRASIETKHHKEMSIDIWEWNKAVVPDDLSLSQLCPLTQEFMKYVGFNDNTKVIDICQWHIDKIRSQI